MEKVFKKFFRSSIFTSSILILLGILLVFKSKETITSISYITGGILIVLGTVAVIKFIRNANKGIKNSIDIVYGIVTIIFGMMVIKNPKAIGSIIPLVIGVSIIVSSATKLQYAFELKTNKNDLWKATMIIAIISALCGTVLLFNPFKGAQVITKVIGIFIIIYAILDMISTFTIKNNVNKIHDALENGIKEAKIIDEEDEK